MQRHPVSSIFQLIWSVGTYPRNLSLVIGTSFVLSIITIFLVYFSFFAAKCLRRAQNRREKGQERRRQHRQETWLKRGYEKRLRMENDNEGEREKRRRELQEREKAQRNARKYQKPLTTAPEAAHISPSSSINFNGSHRSTHGPSASIASSESSYSRRAHNVSCTLSQIDAWNLDVERGQVPDNASLRTDASSQGHVRLQKHDRSISSTSTLRAPAYVQDDASMYSSASAQRRTPLQTINRGHSEGALSHESLSQDTFMGSIGSSSLLFNDRLSIDQNSTPDITFWGTNWWSSW